MRARVYRDVAGEWRWTLYASNGEAIADSAEGYKDERDARHGLLLVLATNEHLTEIETER